MPATQTLSSMPHAATPRTVNATLNHLREEIGALEKLHADLTERLGYAMTPLTPQSNAKDDISPPSLSPLSCEIVALIQRVKALSMGVATLCERLEF